MILRFHSLFSVLVIAFTWTTSAAELAWSPGAGPLRTRWAKNVSPGKSHPEYPRPQMQRDRWMNLNGLWEFSLTGKEAPQPQSFSQKILVPFPVESSLSGVMTNVTENMRIWYRRTFDLPRKWREQRVLLHFGAVDFETMVWVNGKKIGEHRGGYDPFSFDITGAVDFSERNEIVVPVWDPTDAGPYARGKQVRKPDQGIFYTATSGIWQTVWLEPVTQSSIEKLEITPDLDAGSLRINATVRGTAADLEINVKGAATVKGKAGTEIVVPIKNPRLWAPEHPFLYDLKITLKEGRRKMDSVKSYFGMRKVSLARDDKGVLRIFLNNNPYFMVGPLDQGFWPDGLYTAPTDEALRSDIEITKKLGFNMARKHVKVEPERWYYWTDKLGLLVWQDMPSGDKFIQPNDPDIQRTPESAKQFETELKALIDSHENHPSIVMWVVFNEGWGQYDTARVTKWTKEYDPTRLVNNASGWADRKVGDVNDMHKYPGPGSPEPEPARAAVLGEFGGLGFKVDGHTWAGRTWGYRGMESVEKLTRQYLKLMSGVYDLKEKAGLSAAVYTQTTDVEYEGNGLLTYDREVVKMDRTAVAEANRGHVPPMPQLKTLVPTAKDTPVLWRYTMESPPNGWFAPDFDASSWKEGPAGFGTRGTPGAVVRTEWNGKDIWLRREFQLANEKIGGAQLLMHHDEDAEVYLNGVLAVSAPQWTSDYEEVEIRPEARTALRQGKNVIAIHCKQTTGGQYIDAGLVEVVAP